MTEFIRIYGSPTDTTPRGLVPARKSKDLSDDQRFIYMCDIRGYFPEVAVLLVESQVDNTVNWLTLGPTKLHNQDVFIVEVDELGRRFIPVKMTSSPSKNFWEEYGPSMKRLNCLSIEDALQYTEADIEDAASIIFSKDDKERLKFKTSITRAIRETKSSPTAAITQKTLAYILNNCAFGRHPLEVHFPYQFTNLSPRHWSTETKATKKPIAEINLIVWNEFDQSLQDFLNSKNKLLRSTHPMPNKFPVTDLESEFDMTSFLSTVYRHNINKFMSEDFRVQSYQHQHFGKPDIVFKKNDKIVLLYENKPENAFDCPHVQDLIDRFKNQAISTDGNSNIKARPINQVLNYLVLNQVRYAILTNLDQSYAFERIEDDHGNVTVRVSNRIYSSELLQVTIFLLHRSLSDIISGPIKVKFDSDTEYTPGKDQEGSPDDDEIHDKEDREPRKLYKGHYTPRDDALNNRKKFEQHVCEFFQEWDFELTKPTVVLGYGRTGFTTLGSAWNVYNPEDRTEVAVKMADYLKMEELLEEMKNEARIMVYANNRGLKCVPRLIWSGYFGFGGELYVNCTERVIGESRNLNKLNSKEKRMLREALEELRSANILHCDIEDRNVLFGEEQCYIIDYGCARLYKKDTMKELEVDIDEASDSEVKSSSITEEATTSQASEANKTYQ